MWAGIALAAMLGQIGLPGGGFGHGYGSMGSVGSSGPAGRLPALAQGANPVPAFIPVARIADLLLQPGRRYDYDGRRLTYPDIRLVYWAGGNPFHHHQDLGRLRRAFARPDTVIVHEPHWTATARHADIVLPVTTSLEREDIGAGRRDTHLIAMHRASTRSGWPATTMRCWPAWPTGSASAAAFTEGRTARQWLEHLYGEWRARLAQAGHDLPCFAEFWAAGQVALPPGPERYTLFERFRADPGGAPLPTPSGRIEIFSATVAGFGYAGLPRPPGLAGAGGVAGRPAGAPVPAAPDRQPARHPAAQPAGRGRGQPGRPRWPAGRRSGCTRPTPRPAASAAGDVVRVFSDRGACLAGAVLTDAVRPGVARLPTGAWFDPVPGGPGPVLCAHGNPNALTADVPSSRLSQGSTGQHVLVEVERYPGVPPPVTVGAPPPLRPG